MNEVSTKSHSLALALRSLITLLLVSVPISAQSGPRGTLPRPNPGTPTRPTSQPPPGLGAWEFKIPQMEREAASPRTPEEEKLVLTQVAEDFQRIQVINNRMMAKAMKETILNYKDISETTSEIKRRANRIKANLRLPLLENPNVVKTPAHLNINDAARMKTALLALDQSIMSFINSPIFKNTSVVNLEAARKASDDLATIIEFSHLLSKDAKRLSKSSAPAQ